MDHFSPGLCRRIGGGEVSAADLEALPGIRFGTLARRDGSQPRLGAHLRRPQRGLWLLCSRGRLQWRTAATRHCRNRWRASGRLHPNVAQDSGDDSSDRLQDWASRGHRLIGQAIARSALRATGLPGPRILKKLAPDLIARAAANRPLIRSLSRGKCGRCVIPRR